MFIYNISFGYLKIKGGVIIIGEKTITFYDNNLNNPYTIPIQDEITQ